MTLPSIDSITRPLSSNVFEAGRLDPCERSPIRTLSEDRFHVSLRLGPLLSDTTDETEEPGELPIHPALTSKAAGKRVARRRTARSPLQEVSMKKRSDDKDANQNSSLIHQAISSLTNISYIHHTHYQFTYLNPLPSSPIAPLGDSSSPHQAAKHITDPTNLACRDHDARSDLRIINK
ncbi:hypothetical protein F2Q70_00012989 [Brassica cretica]|uniref:Uncharacterized protein n=1 Tax=Brassica cretica TaxID=69181 RepID=A0A8S9LX95_BRACR|nr:hypothetical protein F2Q70_00012989 [Brassica cretica]